MLRTTIALQLVVAVMGLIATEARSDEPRAVLVIHGGAGTLSKEQMTPELGKLFRGDLEQALRAGYAALEKPEGTSLDAVEAALRVLEDSPRYNAGKGAVFTSDGRNELDASIMEGTTKRAGAVAGVTTIKNPISAARAVMEKSPHVMMAGKGAEQFAKEVGVEIVDPSYFRTEVRWQELQKELAEQKRKTDKDTVGAVAVDRHGHLAAGTSTGGMTAKRYGRVGDSPIIGAGTYADDQACAVSATGYGEFFIRYCVAHDIVARVKYKGLSVREASEQVIVNTLKPIGGEGGVIVLDPKGRFAMTYNTEGMYRGYVTPTGEVHVAIYAD